jgi:transposase
MPMPLLSGFASVGFSAPFMVNEVYQPLQRLTRFRCHLMHQITTEKNYFLTFLFLKFSEYQNLDPLSNTFGAASQAVLMDYLTVDEIVAAPLEELASLVAKEGRNHFPSPEAVAAAVKRAAKDSYRPHPNLNEPLNLGSFSNSVEIASGWYKPQ